MEKQKSPISPSISAFGTNAATESTTITSNAPLLINDSAISNACSPVSGCDTIKLSISTPRCFAYTGSNACSEKVGVMFGNPETTTGGRALKYYASVRLDIRKVENIKQDGEVIGNRAKVKVVKNKVAPPFREAEFDILYGKGISREGNILDLAVNLDIIEKSGSWFSYNGEKIAQGRENTKKYLLENPEITNEIEKKVRDNFNKAFENSLTNETENQEDDEET